MKQVDIKGIIVPIITPMREDESINVDVLKEQCDRMIEAGIHAIFCFGTNGEGYILNGKEKELVLSTVVKHVNGRVPVYAGTGCISTKETIEQSKMAEACGADVLSIITPSFAAASQDEIQRHYETVAAAVPEMPIVLYNIPARTGNRIDPKTVGKLAQVDNIVGAKDSGGDFKNILGYIDAGKSRKDGKFAVLSGNDQLILWTLKAGGTGGISGCANAYPHNMAMIYNEYVAGNWDEAKKYQDAIAPFRENFAGANPNTVVKTAVRLMGYDVGLCRAPFNMIPDEKIEAIKKNLAENKANGMS
ncbi:4-hydroxy-tetrahydrodipicolinate synthase [Oribacterium sp. KHPX15]|uniref:4-hydroxy-tetrahydrodipicolinate synthase n=1 Tax=Oribacterium sp. KHPX15 TaxID=1855342 RepID=UPI0008963FD5|nr:4-hydroxy-tetrahydrodipicolinate synthase [Oribacterium sp. KHPX15]SEA23822.1 4-hydroxy-tetrahydrodipicolinate synthase [Oribacterium sp. KHPX15]